MGIVILPSKLRGDSTLALVVFIIIFLGILLIHPYAFILIYILLCVWVLVGPKQAIQALSLNYLILFLNPVIFAAPSETGLFRWIILFIAGLRVVPSISHRVVVYLFSLLLFFLCVTILAYLVSPAFTISFFKITAFTYGAATFLIAYNGLDERSLDQLKNWFQAISIAVVLLSLPTLMIRRVGFHTNGSGFQGVLSHPQAFGVFLAPTVAYLAANIVLVRKPRIMWEWLFEGIAVLFMFFSRCRTAMLAMLMSLGTAIITYTLSSRRKVTQMAPSRNLIFMAFGLGLLFAVIAISPMLSSTVEKFWTKGEETTVEDSFYRSRGIGVEFYWKRFLQQPLTGHGFGVDIAQRASKNIKTFLGIPLSSSVEKGFLPVAFLEEVGIIGLISFIPLFLVLLMWAVSQSDIGLISMFFACLFVNIGEAVFFSIGHMGGYLWLLIGLSTAPGWKKYKTTLERSKKRTGINDHATDL
jgi:hypothetical protein